MKKQDISRITLLKKTIIDTLVAAGYEKVEQPLDPKNYRKYPNMCSPQIIASSEMERKLARFNFGEAYFRLDWIMGNIECLGRHALPDSKHYIPVEDAHEIFWNILTFGEEFSYNSNRGLEEGEYQQRFGIIKIVDLKLWRNNSFTLVEDWSGAQGNGFVWDIVLCVNDMPIVGFNFKPDTIGNEPMDEVLNETIAELDTDPVFSTYAQVIFVSDGTSVRVADPFADKDEYMHVKMEHLTDMLSPEALIKSMQAWPKQEETPQPKRGRGRSADPFLCNQLGESKFIEHLKNIVETYFVPEQNMMHLLDKQQMINPSKFFACLYSACIEYRVALAGASTKKLSKLLDKAVESAGCENSFTLGYEAINTQVRSWEKLVKMGAFSSRPLIHEISRENLLEPQSQRVLNDWKDLYQQVVQIGINEGLFDRG